MIADVTPTIGFTFAAYIIAMLAIGLYAYRRTHNLADYLLGGRRIGPWVTALSASASDMSGWLLLGLPGYAYAAGFEAFWIALGLLVGTWLNWRLVARRLRHFTAICDNALTLSDFLERRFADRSHMLRLVSALFILLFFTFYTSSGLVAGGRLFEAVFGMDYTWAVICGAAIIVLYTFLGGFLAVCWTDLVQGLLMLGALLIAPLAAIQANGGWAATQGAMQTSNPQLLDSLSSVNGDAIGLLGLISLLAWGLGYFGQPHILARFMAIRSVQALVPARRIAVGWVFLSLTGALLVGFAGIGYLEPTLEGAETEKVFMHLVGALFHPLLAGILLAAILAAVMSTADSQLLVASGAFTEDIYKELLGRRADPNELVWVGRVAVAIIALIALLLALRPDSKVLDLVAYAWAGFGAAFGPTLLFALFWMRMTRNGALAGILVGGGTVILWKQLEGGIFDLYEIVPGFALSCLAIIIFSLLDHRNHVVEEVFTTAAANE